MHFLEQLHVFERERELPAEVVDRIDKLPFVEIPGFAFDDDRAERAAPAAERRDQDPAPSAGVGVRNCGPVEPQPAGRNRVRLGRHAGRGGGVGTVGGPGQGELARAAIVNPDRHPPGAEEVVDLGAQRFEGPADAEAWPRCRAKTRAAAPGCGGAAKEQARAP